MTRRGTLGRLAAHFEGNRQPVATADGGLFSPSDLFADQFDRPDIDREAKALADAALAPLVAMALERKAAPGDTDVIATILADHGDVLLQASAFAAFTEAYNGFLASARVDKVRTLTGLPHLADADRRHAVAFTFVEFFIEGLGGIITEVARAPAGMSKGVN